MTDRPKYIDELNEKGYAVIPNVLTPEQVKYAKDEFFKWKSSNEQIDFVHKNFDPHGIYKYCEVGNQRHCWYIRTLPNVIDVFKNIWGTDNLVVSYDGCCYFPKEFRKKDKYWTHSDQSSDKVGLRCVQGFVALTSNKERTLRVYDGTHKMHEDYFKERNIFNSNDWNILDQDYIAKLEDKERVLDVSEGSMVIWDSRTFHQNQYGPPNCEERLVQYVCYLPRDSPLYTESVYYERLECFNERRTTSHWPYPIVPVPKQPYNYYDYVIDYDSLEKPYLEDLQKKIDMLI